MPSSGTDSRRCTTARGGVHEAVDEEAARPAAVRADVKSVEVVRRAAAAGRVLEVFDFIELLAAVEVELVLVLLRRADVDATPVLLKLQ